MLIIADIHGRTFWRKKLKDCGALVEGKLTKEVVFMGDYLDHYQNEPDPITKNYITSQSEFDNFKDILEFKKDNFDKVTLLLGNHDMEYISDYCVPCRMNREHKKEISDLFKENIDLFKIGVYKKIGDKMVTFTHANICPSWVENINPRLEEIGYKDFKPTKENGKDTCADLIVVFNSLLEQSLSNPSLLDSIGSMLGHIGYGRGGNCPCGSMVWSDLSDYTHDDYMWDDVYQVVAHTQHLVENNRFVYDEHMFCTDCHIDELGNRPIFRLLDEWKPLSPNRPINTCLEII